MKIKNIQLGEPFQSLFRIKDANYKEVLADMKKNGYDPNESIKIWEEENILIDGHTRLQAAKELDIKEIPTKLCTFKNEEQAVKHTFRHNANRRAVTIGDKFRCQGLLDKKQEIGGNRNPEGLGGKSGKTKEDCQNLNLNNDKTEEEYKASAKHTGELIGMGSTNINKMRTIRIYCDQENIEAVEDDELSIDKTWKEAKEIKRKIESEVKAAGEFNQVNENIEWAKWSWNPVTGCKHNCKYCYARDIANRWYEEKFEPTFREKRLPAPGNTTIPKKRQEESGIHNVFVCSMGDLFGDWVPEKWIKKVLHAIKKNTQWNYLLLTKNPKRYLEFDFPDHCWLGGTADTQKRMDNAIEVFSKKEHPIKFISCEPLMEKINIDNPKVIQWLIIGGRSKTTGMPAGQPEWKWVETLLFQARQANISVYFKPNLTVQPKEYPEV